MVEVKDLHRGFESGSQVVFELFDALSFLLFNYSHPFLPLFFPFKHTLIN